MQKTLTHFVLVALAIPDIGALVWAHPVRLD